MRWDTIYCSLDEFTIVGSQKAGFENADALFLLDSSAADRPGTVYVTDGAISPPPFRHALIVSIGPRSVIADHYIELAKGDLITVFNVLLRAKHNLDTLDNLLSHCNSDQEIVDAASLHLRLPMFYLDDSYRILAITRNLDFEGDAEWIHMTQKGYFSPESAKKMQESGDLDLLAGGHAPMIYRSKIYPYTSIVCNIWVRDIFISRLNLLCIDGDTSAPIQEACSIISAHLGRISDRMGLMPADGPLQRMLVDLLRGVNLSQALIDDRLRTHPALTRGLFRILFVDVGESEDRQVAAYFSSLLKGFYPEDTLLPLVFDQQLVLLAHNTDEQEFATLMKRLSEFCLSYRLRCGVSNGFRRLGNVQGYYYQAIAAVTDAPDSGVSYYSDIMLKHMISYIPAGQAEFLIAPDIALLMDAQADYSFPLVKTLRTYLACNCNLNQTAEALFLHKNTLLYRLNHIRSLIRSDLNDADQRLLLMLSFKLLEFHNQKTGGTP